jgi:hypothetical protein
VTAVLLFMQSGQGTPGAGDPQAWLYRLDHDAEFHRTLDLLCKAVGDTRPRITEAVLLLEQYIAFTAPVRITVAQFAGDDWEEAVRRLNNSRSVSHIRHVQHLLRATTTRKASY